MLGRRVGAMYKFRWGQHAAVRRSDAVDSIYFPIGVLICILYTVPLPSA